MAFFTDRISKLPIGKRLWLMAATTLLALILAGALSITNMFRTKTKSFEALDYSANITRAVDTARAAQVHFKKQVQEWKNVLLRGHSPKLYKKYWASFEKEERNVRKTLTALINQCKPLGIKTDLMQQAIEDNKNLGILYRKGLKSYRRGAYTSTFQVDKSVRGIDRQPTDNIDEIVAFIQQEGNRIAAASKAQTQEVYTWSFILTGIIGAFVLVIVLFFNGFTSRSIYQPLTETVQIFNAIGDDNLDNIITINQGGELGDMQKALGTMQSKLKKAKAGLEASLRKVQKLKEDQDGDYFLTSLLTEPLNGNFYNSEAVDFDLILEQKKKFKFRKWKKEIGGDLVAAHNVRLQNLPYLAFVNGDAMGKSVQGAGGALVLGCVFQSIIERTRVSKPFQRLNPEKWLREAFLELHKVFKSFDGSMLSSVVMGLLDERSGTLYFLNAEHPHPVLYRDKVASFIGEEVIHRKLGHLGERMRISVTTVQLQPGDILILGSDGRDDILKQYEENKAINEDETLFLRLVEKAGGKLKKIKQLLDAEGQLTDDLSIVTIKYRGSKKKDLAPEEALKLIRAIKTEKVSSKIKTHLGRLRDEFAEHIHVTKALAFGHYNIKEYEESFAYASEYIQQNPGDSKFIYFATYVGKLAGQTDEAIELGERLRLRQRGNLRNLVNLIDLYSIKKDQARANQLLSEAEEIDANDEYVLRLKKTLSKRTSAQAG